MRNELLILRLVSSIASGMPEFTNAFSGLQENRKLTHQELVRAIRFMISAEYEAIQLYEQLAESTDNTLAIQVLLDIANEEKTHAGEFYRLLQQLAPDEQGFYDEGFDETNEKIQKLGIIPPVTAS
jgi:rubrerythrin